MGLINIDVYPIYIQVFWRYRVHDWKSTLQILDVLLEVSVTTSSCGSSNLGISKSTTKNANLFALYWLLPGTFLSRQTLLSIGTHYNWVKITPKDVPQPAFTCSKLTIEILEQGVKYVQS